MKISENGLNLIKQFEGFRSQCYLDAVQKPTIGYGTLIDTKEEQYLKTKTINESEATQLLRYDLGKYERVVDDLVTVDLNQNQFDALCVFVYNVGLGNFKSSTMLKLVNQKKFTEAADQFSRWNKAGGKVLAGLTRRRQAEMELFIKS